MGISLSVVITILLGLMYILEEWSLYHSEWVTHSRHSVECDEFST